MKPATLKKQREKLDKERKQLMQKLKMLDAKFDYLEAQCEHPNSYTYYAMGDPGTKCPDCGWAN